MHQEECIVVKFSEGLGIFDQHYGSPQIDEQEIYEGPTGKVIDIQGIQAHAGHDFFVPEGKEFSLNIDQCPYLHIAIKAEPGTNTCLFLLVHDRKHDWNQRFVVIGKTPQGECRHHLMSNYFRINDDNEWNEYVYDLRTIREEKDHNVYHQPICPDAGSIREIQFYSWTGSGTHTFHFNNLIKYEAKAEMTEECINQLKAGKPIIVKMETDLGTIKNGEQYLLHYDVDSGGFDFQGYNKGYERYHLARYHNGNINSGVVSIWGVLAYIEERGGELILCRSADDQRIASIDDITKTQYLEYAATKIEKDLEDSGKYWGWKKIAENLETYLDNNYNNYNYSKTRFVAESLEKFSRYLLFVYKKELWDECKKIMEIFQTHLKTKIVYSEATFGVESDYSNHYPFGGDDYLTAALVIRAVHAYYQAVNASYYTFLNLSTVFMRDILARDWSSFNPNGRMQVMWVINRRYEHGLEDENRLKAATNILLVPVIGEQITAPEEWIDDIPRGFGGWMHSMRSTITSKDDENFSDKYKQWMGYHLFIVRGLAEFYRLAHRKGISEEKYLSFYIKNCPYNLMGATYWVYKLSKGNGSIMDRWNNPKVDGCQKIYGTFGGLSAVYEIMRTIPVQNHMPCCLNDPTCCSDRAFINYDDLTEMLESARKYADKYFRSGLDYYPGLLLCYYSDFRPNLF